MKKLLVLTLSVAVLSTQVLYAKSKRYQIRSGIVHYTITGSGGIMGVKRESHGSKTLYFKDYGNIDVQESEETSSMMGHTDKHHQLVKIVDGMVYAVDFQRKVITKQDMRKMMKNKDLSKMGKDMLKEMGGKKVGSGKVLGYPCEIWEVMGTKLWIYKGVTLKIESNVMGMTHSEVATDAKFGVSIPDSKLTLPDYPTQSLNEMIEHEMNKPDAEGNRPSPEEMKQMKEMLKGLGGMFGGK